MALDFKSAIHWLEDKDVKLAPRMGPWNVEEAIEREFPGGILAFIAEDERLSSEWDATSKRRYTVELTMEGWQIKDNERGTICADVFSDRLTAENKAVRWSRHDAAKS